MSIIATVTLTEKKRSEPGFLGGLASMSASFLTHPLDTIKVQLQTQKQAKFGFVGMAVNIVKTGGVLSLYNGVSAALLMSGTYSTVRFAFYEAAKEYMLAEKSSAENQSLTFIQKIFIAATGGALGSVFGNPFDLVNIRMQNDSKLPLDERRNYRHCIDGLCRIVNREGSLALYFGFHLAVARAIFVSVGQLAFYDELKTRLIRTYYFKDDAKTHFLASMGAGLIATLFTMPVDVIKTLVMNAKPGEKKNIFFIASELLKVDKLGLFKGFWPRYVRLGPFTVLAFIFYERLKLIYHSQYNY